MQTVSTDNGRPVEHDAPVEATQGPTRSSEPLDDQLRRGNTGNRLVWSNHPDPDAAGRTILIPQGLAAKARRVPAWPEGAVRIGFGLIWLIDAVFKWRPGFVNGFHDMVVGQGKGQPSWLHGFYTFTGNIFSSNTHAWAYGIAALETVIALALIFGFARKITYIMTIVAALAIWAVAEGFGGPYTASSTDIGAAVMYAPVALALLVLSLQAGPSRYSIDYYIEKRISWWHKVAEFGAHNHPTVDKQEPAPPALPARPVGTAI